MSTELSHSLTLNNNLLTVNGIKQVVEISEREAVLKLYGKTLTVRGSGLNVAKLDRDQGLLQLETQSIKDIVYRTSVGGLKGLFK